MSDIVIRAEGLGKKYLIGHESREERYTALRDVLGRTAKGFARSAGDMLRGRQIIAGDEIEEFWALRDVNFEIKRGEVVGIIGRNGAGKSTLLKILSRITEPSAGRVEIKGRVASLLEVGTGFHPELTGCENIFLNGAILGMSRMEIKSKFDEIIAFAEVEKFLDTPVKRYSSGMYVRLAFAVAAHLEPEILVVDEVLAVGDAEFQKKCLGKMQDVAGHGRTVLFVSHNMAAVASLCSKALLLEGGQVTGFTYVDDIISSYTKRTRTTKTREFHNLGDEHAQLLSITVNDSNGISHDEFRSDQQIHVSLLVRLLNKACRFRLGFRLDQDGVGTVFTTTETDGHPMRTREIGDYQFTCLIPPNLLSPGDYTITPAADMPMVAVLFQLTDAISFTVSPVGAVGGAIPDGRRGIIRPRLDWQEQKASPVEPPIIAELHQ